MATSTYQGKKFDGNSSMLVVDSLTVEEALQININDEPFTVTMRTPGDDIALVRGLLNSEGIINDLSYTPDVILKNENPDGIVTIVDLKIPEDKLGSGYSNSRSLLSVSSCGICGRKELEELAFIGKVLDEKKTLDFALIRSMFERMQTVQKTFNQSGGSHAAVAFNFNGELLVSMEDIGRHNAVDKVVGHLINNKQLKEAACITVSGRVSYEIIIKAFKARIPVICAVSAPSTLAVDFAKELGISLLAFCRENRATCYSHPERIRTTNLKSNAG